MNIYNPDSERYFHQSYEYNRQLYQYRFKKDDPILQNYFLGFEEILNQIDYFQFFAYKEFPEFKQFEVYNEISNLEKDLINKRIKKRRKSAIFYGFFRYSFTSKKSNKSIRGYVSEKIMTAHTFKNFLKSKSAYDMVKECIQNIILRDVV